MSTLHSPVLQIFPTQPDIPKLSPASNTSEQKDDLKPNTLSISPKTTASFAAVDISSPNFISEDFKQTALQSPPFMATATSLIHQLMSHPDIPVLGQSTDIESVLKRIEGQLDKNSFQNLEQFVECVKKELNQFPERNRLNFWTRSAFDRVRESFLVALRAHTDDRYQFVPNGTSGPDFPPLLDLNLVDSLQLPTDFEFDSFPEPIGNLNSPQYNGSTKKELALFTSPLNERETGDVLVNYDIPVYPGAIIDPREALDHKAKKQLRDELAALPTRMLGEVMYVLRQAQPENVEVQGDQLVLDIKKLNNSTLLHLRAYVQTIQSQMIQAQLQQAQQQMGAGANGTVLMNEPSRRTRQSRKRRRNPNKVGRPRKKRTSFSSSQKEALISFWAKRMWKPCTEESVLQPFAESIGVSSEQVKVFRQNNRKKYISYLPRV